MAGISQYDVIIAGGGPAGSTAGYILSKSGFRVLLIDKSKFPRHKLCGGCITHKTIKLLERVFGETAEDLKKREVLNFESNHYEIFCKNKLISKTDTQLYFYFIDRYIYDNFLLDKAKQAGVEVIEGERVISFNISDNEVHTESGQVLTTRLLIGADGINSVIRRQFPGKIFNHEIWQHDLGNAVEIFIKRSDIQKVVDHPTLYFDFINHGYAWMFPNRDKFILGIGGLARKNKKQFMPAFNDFLSMLNLGGLTTGNIRGYTFPYGNFILTPVFKNIILIGDAAGFADPLLGEGIYYAQRSAELAAQAICDCAREGKDLDYRAQQITDKYLRLLHEKIFPELIYARKIRKFIFRFLSKHHYLPLKIMMNLIGTKPVEAVHGIRSYKWLKKLP